MTDITVQSEKNSFENKFFHKNRVVGGEWEQIKDYNSILITITSDQSSAHEGIIIDFSSKYSDRDITATISRTYDTSNKEFSFRIPKKNNIFRLTYINGDVDANVTLKSVFSSIEVNEHGTMLLEVYDDAYGRSKVVNPHTILDIKHTCSKNEVLDCEKIVGKGTSVFNRDTSSVTLSVSKKGDKVIRQSRRSCIYQPGKMMTIIASGVLNFKNNGKNTSSKIGLFDGLNGIYFEYINEELYVVLLSSVYPIEKIPRSQWNIDKLDGKGPSKLTIDSSNILILLIEMQWLGGGHVKCGIAVKNRTVFVHSFNNYGKNKVYIKDATLPVRYEIESLDDKHGKGSLSQICSSVISEGGYNPYGNIYNSVVPFSKSGIVRTNTTNSQERVILIARRKMKSGKIAMPCKVVKPKSLTFLSTSSANVLFNVYLFYSMNDKELEDFTDIKYDSADNDCIIETYIPEGSMGLTKKSSGIPLPDNSNYKKVKIDAVFMANNLDSVKLNVDNYNNNIFISYNIDKQSDYLVVTGRNLNAPSEQIYTSFKWEEIE